MNKKTKRLKGISLIVLVITILVLSILAATVIISLSNTNIIGETNKAVLKSNIQSLQDRVTSYTADNYDSIDMKKEYTLSEYGITEEEFKKYQTIAVVKGGKVYIKPNADSDILEVARELNVLLDGTISNSGSLELASTNVKSLRIYGNSIQNGTPSESTPVEIQSVGEKSKNLFDISRFQLVDKTVNGISYKFLPDNRIEVSGKILDNTQGASYTSNTIAINNAQKLKAGTYSVQRLEVDGKDIEFFVCAYDEDGNFIVNIDNKAKVIDKDFYILRFGVYFNYNITSDINIIINSQLELGNTATDYEPYGYNIPVRTSGKNLFDVDNFISTFNQFKPAGYETTKTEFDGYECIKVFGAMRSEAQNVQYLKDKFKSNTQYTFTMDIYDVSGETSTLKGISGKINYTDGTTDLFTLVAREFDVWQPISVVSKENKSIDYISFTYGTGAAYSYIKNWQIEEGTTATEYEPYNATIYNIYLKEPLRKLGSTADYIDCTTGEVVRYIRLKDTTGTKGIEESFEVLTTPTTEKVSVSDIDYTNKKYVSVDTTVIPSSIETRY